MQANVAHQGMARTCCSRRMPTCVQPRMLLSLQFVELCHVCSVPLVHASMPWDTRPVRAGPARRRVQALRLGVGRVVQLQGGVHAYLRAFAPDASR